MVDFNKLRKKKVKQKVSFTMDKDLYDNLVALKEEQGIETLSPLLNDALQDWYNDLDEEEEEEKEEQK